MGSSSSISMRPTNGFLFETLRAEMTSASLPRQELMLPETLEVSGAESAWLAETLPAFAQLGFALDLSGPPPLWYGRSLPPLFGRSRWRSCGIWWPRGAQGSVRPGPTP